MRSYKAASVLRLLAIGGDNGIDNDFIFCANIGQICFGLS